MIQEYEYQVPEGSLKYTKSGDGITITGFTGLAGRVEVPEQMEGLQVIRIDRKAFLSKKHLRGIVLPASIQEVGDWAFAYCDHLKQVTFQGDCQKFGKAVFLDCRNLAQIDCPEQKSVTEDPGQEEQESAADQEQGNAETVRKSAGCGSLLAAAVTKMDSDYLLDLEEAGKEEWYRKWDARLLAILHTPDAEGYSRQVLCGEEDYGSTDLAAYLSGSRKKKIRLIYLRLLAPKGLSKELKKECTDYLLTHTKGCESEESWQVILEEYAHAREYYELFAEIGCFHKDNAAAVIAGIGEENAEMKAYFLKYQADHFGGSDFFGGLDF